ncbi:MAG: YceI family protein [Balneolaceae bacterium]|nr:YceI family protein [Balneolaceae bacterium]
MKVLKPLLTALLMLVVTTAYAQQPPFEILESSTVIIEGTSTIHDWEADVEEINGNIFMNPSALEAMEESDSPFIPSLNLSFPVKSIESGKGGMNKRIYNALDDKKNPVISFILNSAEKVETDTLKQEGAFLLDVTGDLTIKGETKTVNFNVVGTQMDANTYKFTGSYHMNMTDYGVDPPSAMLGTIKAGEEIDIKFEIMVGRKAS